MGVTSTNNTVFDAQTIEVFLKENIFLKPSMDHQLVIEDVFHSEPRNSSANVTFYEIVT